MTEVEKSHTGKPIVSPGSDNVAIWGAPKSPQEEKGLGFPPRGIPWLVDSIFSTQDQRRKAVMNIPFKIIFLDALTQLVFSVLKSREKTKDDSSRLRFLLILK